MIVILDRNKAERLQNAVIEAPHRAQDFGHPVNRAGLRLKSDFHKVTFPQALGQAQQSTGCGDALQFGFCAAAIFKTNRSQD